MNIGVCAKVTPDTATQIKVTREGDGIETAGVKWVVSPYDMFAIEEAVKLTEKDKGSDVILFTVGDSKVISPLRANGLALGAASLVHIDDAQVIASDSLATAKALAAAIKESGVDAVFCGMKALDDDAVQVPAMVAEVLGWPQVSMISALEVEGGSFKATRNIGGGVQEVVSGQLPAVFTCDKGLNTPRYPKLPAIMKAKKKPVTTRSAADLGLSAEDVAPRLTVSNYGPPAARPPGRILTGDLGDQITELVQLLRNEAKVI